MMIKFRMMLWLKNVEFRIRELLFTIWLGIGKKFKFTEIFKRYK